jgi:hypothetical protein
MTHCLFVSKSVFLSKEKFLSHKIRGREKNNKWIGIPVLAFQMKKNSIFKNL